MQSCKIPIIDIHLFIASSTQSEKLIVAEAVHDACTNFGFFYVVGHGISQEAIKGIRQKAQTFFDCSMEDKMKIAIDKGDYARGYQKIVFSKFLILKGQNVTMYKNDWHEALDYYAPVDHNHTIAKRGISVLSGKNPYPELEEFSSVLESYVKDMKKLGQAIMSSIALSLGLKQEYFDQFMTDPFWVIRLIGYPPLPSDHDGVSCGQHTDYGCLTILNTDDTRDALQVLSKEGEWITVNPITGAFLINIGDMVNNWTNDLYSATLHRVIHKNTNYRISVPFFYEPNFDAIISPIPELCRGSPKYEPVMYGDHLLSKVSNNFSTKKQI